MDNGPRLSVRTIALTIALVAAFSSTLPAGAAATEQVDELVLTMAATGKGATVVQGTLQAAANTTHSVQLERRDSCSSDPRTPFGSAFDVTTNSSGYASFTTAVSEEVVPGSGMMAVANGIIESNCVTVVADTSPPTVSMGDLPTFQTEATFPVTWQGSDQTEVRFHVVFRQAAFNGVFGAEEALVIDTTATSEVFSGKPGRTYCFRTVARDLLNNTSSTGEECSAVLVDDASMKHRKGFKQRSGGDHFMGTFSTAKRTGATLILSGVQADQLAILIDRCKRCGKVRVTFPGMKRTVSLKGPKDTQVLVTLADLSVRATGALRVKSLTDRPVRVDAAGISAV